MIESSLQVTVAVENDSRLPALIDRARNRLESARSSAEVLEAKAIAETALHYAKVTKAANETHADCLRMIVRAEVRMASEIDAGQERGDVAAGGRREKPSEVRTVSEATLGDLGVSRQRLSEWRDVRDAGLDVVEEAISAAVSENRAPTKSDVRRAVERRKPDYTGHASALRTPCAPSNGMQFARIAILKLEEIRDDDSERQQAFAHVRRWLDARET